MFDRPAEAADALLTRFPPALLVQVCFVFAAVSVLTVAALPASTRRILTQYGARSSTEKPADGQRDILADFFSTVTTYGQVPHSWFIHFYILSVCSSVFWAWQLVSDGHVLKYIVMTQARSQPATNSMSLQQVVIAWSLVSLQGMRRLCEYLSFTKPSSSQMWVVHWLLGSAYYVGMGVALWIEGSCKFSDALLDISMPSSDSSNSINTAIHGDQDRSLREALAG